jgi:predicted TIM-barrel fold metal-dependent hydrolase
MFGTNFPMIAHTQALEGLDALGLDDETRELFLHGNAERLLNVGGGDSPPRSGRTRTP